MAMELLHPRVGRESECDLGLSQLVLRGANTACPRKAGAPVDRTSMTVPASIADASCGAVARSTTSVMVTPSDAPESAPPPRLPTATTTAAVNTYPARPES